MRTKTQFATQNFNKVICINAVKLIHTKKGMSVEKRKVLSLFGSYNTKADEQILMRFYCRVNFTSKKALREIFGNSSKLLIEILEK